ncbi:hypothetical protein RJ641_019674 [Dillenia turbinata]|uniref:C2H2-type domain-containing protein n=1 Tax=Dillenia turbinata TaxID=194707 RepID=A0AAN8UVT1_9MAGN
MMSSPSSQEIITTLNPQPLNSFPDNTTTTTTTTTTVKHQHHQNPRRKRTKVKLVKLDQNNNQLVPKISKPKHAKNPDPNAPEVTEPCSECGRKFWSWKALFGHMRCHPERTWRGINPPPNFRRAPQISPGNSVDSSMTDEDHEVANCLLMLANTCATVSQSESDNSVRDMQAVTTATTADCLRFECSSCKKVFGSHQALGGHRASHKNVKGCFAITRINDVDGGYMDNEGAVPEGDHGEGGGDHEKMMMVLGGHKCSICLRVFSSGQALGGHKRCHWEKGETSSMTALALAGFQHYGLRDGSCGLDLNLPAPLEEDSSSSYSTDLSLELRLGI